MSVEITRRIEFDAGHRIPDHSSKCKNVHGHRYVLEATFAGPVKDTRRMSDDGMIVDFGILKTLMQTNVGDVWDHGCLVAESDHDLIGGLKLMGPYHKTVVVDCIPTVENLARLAFDNINKGLNGSRVSLARVRLFETPNCWADAYPELVRI